MNSLLPRPPPLPQWEFLPAWELLINFSVQATVLLLLLLAFLWGPARRWSAAKRHLLLLGGCLALPGLLVLGPVLADAGLALSWTAPPTTAAASTASAPTPTSAPSPTTGATASPSPAAPSTSLPLPSPLPPPLPQAHSQSLSQVPVSPAPLSSSPAPFSGISLWLPAALPGLWAAGVLVGLLRLALGLGSLQLTARRAAPGTEKLRRELEQGSTRWAPGSRVALREGTPGEMPLTWGILRHIISLPPEAAAWPASRRRTVFRHELAHVQRRDFLWLTLARLAVLPVWWHPLAWWVVRELARTAEHAADDHATGTGTGADRAAYAGDLVTIVSSCHRNRTGGGLLAPLRIGLGLGLGLALAMAMGRPRPTVLRRRVEALLEPVRDRAAFGPRGRTALALATTLLMVGLAGLAACRPQSAEEPAPEQSASKEPSVPQPPVMETRIYELGTHQRAVLLATLVPAKSRPAVDPFGGGQPAPPPTDKEKTDRLALCATLVREHLFGTGRVSYPKHARPEVTMESERAMSLTAAPATHAEVSAYLARYDSGPQVLLRTYMMEVDVGWAPWAQAGLQTPTGQMQVNGVLTPAEGRLLLEALNKDPRAQATISMPAIITRSGRPSRMDMVREFIYPTEFDPAHFTPPGTPKSPVGSSPGPVVNASLGDTDGTFTPTTPTAFEMRPIGRQLEVNALVLPDGRHQLDLTWEITEFMGFMNYGQPIKKTSTGTDGKRHEITVSENRIEQPIFQSMKVSTSAVVEPGHYLVMGGIKPERSATLEGMSEALHRPPGRVADAPSDKGRPVMYVLILQSNLMELPAAIPVPVPGTPTTPSPATGKE